jgi:hypothetical protein
MIVVTCWILSRPILRDFAGFFIHQTTGACSLSRAVFRLDSSRMCSF